VTHGWTLARPCGFREVCKAIRESAFETNELPIIISLEVHTTNGQQELMVQIMKEEWKGLLLEEPLEGWDPKFRVPRLEELKNKILVKVKKASAKTDVPSNTLQSPTPHHGLDDDASGSEDERLMPPSETFPGAQRSAKKVAIGQALSSLAIYTHSEHFKSFETPAAKKPSHIFSIGESKILELHTTKNTEMFTHNKNFFMRAFPNGARFDSSNLDPSLFWRKGVQMVAMNWQSHDEGMMLNDAMFANEMGWVLKPPGYRSSDKVSTSQADAAAHKVLNLDVTIYAGQHTIDPHAIEAGESSKAMKKRRPIVKCELHVEKPEERSSKTIEGGGQAREGEFKRWTKPVKGDHPDLGDEGFTLSFTNIPGVVEELSFVR
jgi:phosphatidylinositol phospholipase C, delta